MSKPNSGTAPKPVQLPMVPTTKSTSKPTKGK